MSHHGYGEFRVDIFKLEDEEEGFAAQPISSAVIKTQLRTFEEERRLSDLRIKMAATPDPWIPAILWARVFAFSTDYCHTCCRKVHSLEPKIKQLQLQRRLRSGVPPMFCSKQCYECV